MAFHLHHLIHLEQNPSPTTSDRAVDREVLCISSSHQAALQAIAAGIEERKGLLVLCGESGLGKTTLVRSYVDSIDQQRLQVIYLPDAALSFGDLLQYIHRALTGEVSPERASGMVSELRKLRQVLIKAYEKNRHLVLMIDNAHNLPLVTLTNLGLLASLEVDHNPLMPIVLIGQPILSLSPQVLQRLEQHIQAHMTLVPLTTDESIDFIHHCLAQVTSDRELILSPGALRHIVKHAGGIPKLLHILCADVLNAGLRRKERPISAATAKEAIAEFTGYRPGLMWPWELIDARTLRHQVQAIIHAGWHSLSKGRQSLAQRVADSLQILQRLGSATLKTLSARIRWGHLAHGTHRLNRVSVQAVGQCRMVYVRLLSLIRRHGPQTMGQCRMVYVRLFSLIRHYGPQTVNQCRVIYVRLLSLIRRRASQTIDKMRAEGEEDLGLVVSRLALAGSVGGLILLAGLWGFSSYVHTTEPAIAGTGTVAVQPAVPAAQRQTITRQQATAPRPVATATEAHRAVTQLRVRLGSNASERHTAYSGEQIRLIQERLQTAGFSPGPIDGILGPQTHHAIRQFQETRNLKATGTLNAATLQALGF